MAPRLPGRQRPAVLGALRENGGNRPAPRWFPRRMTATRRLAAILAADVAGDSRLMGADEEGTPERLKAHRPELLHPQIAAYHGRLVKTTSHRPLVQFAP